MRTVRAKLFQNGGSQAVRLPKECRFATQGEVLVRRAGRRVIQYFVDRVRKAPRQLAPTFTGHR